MVTSQTLNQGVFKNTLNAGIKGAIDFPISILDAVGADETARSWEQSISNTFPTYPGSSEFIGSIAGSLMPVMPSAYIKGASLLLKSPRIIKNIHTATSALFATQAFGHGRRGVKEYERKTGEDVSQGAEYATALGYGAVTLVSERFGMQSLMKNIDRIKPMTLKRLGQSIVKKKAKDAARILGYIGKVTGREMLEEGVQEMTEEIAQNGVSAAIYDTDQEILEGAGRAFLGGAIGGGFMQGVGIAAGSKNIQAGIDQPDATFINVGGKEFQIDDIYHGTGAKFDKFDLSYVGTGEGHASFGWGVNVSDVPDIARGYADKTNKDIFTTVEGVNIEFDNSEDHVKKQFTDFQKGFISDKKVLTALSSEIDNINKDINYYKVGTKDSVDTINSKINIEQKKIDKYQLLSDNISAGIPIEKSKTNLLSLTLFKGKKEFEDYQFLDWYNKVPKKQLDSIVKALEDQKNEFLIKKEKEIKKAAYDEEMLTFKNYTNVSNPLDSPGFAERYNRRVQSQMAIHIVEITEFIRKLRDGKTVDIEERYGVNAPAIGELVYSDLSNILGSQRDASEFLITAGIDGNRFPTGSKGIAGQAGTGGTNYIIFDADNVTIEDRTQFQTNLDQKYVPIQSAHSDVIIGQLQKSGLVSAVRRVTDQKEWDTLIQRERESSPGLPQTGKVYGMFEKLIDTETGEKSGRILLGPEFMENTAGHELFHAFSHMLGEQHPVIQKGYKMMRDLGYKNPTEDLANFVGDIYYQRSIPRNIYQKVGDWLGDFWASVQVKLGYGSEEAIAKAMNIAMKPGKVFSAQLGMPNEWDPIDVDTKQLFEKLGITRKVDSEGNAEPVRDTMTRIRELIPDAQSRILNELDVKRSKNTISSNEDIKKAEEDILSDPSKIEFELKKVLEGRKREYDANTNLVWYNIQEAANVKAFKEIMNKQTNVDPEMARRVRESIDKMSQEIQDGIVHPASQSGWNLQWWKEHETQRHLFKNLARLKKKLSKKNYEILFQASKGERELTPEEIEDIIKESGASGKDYFYEWYYSMLLSNPTTHFVNMASNALWQAWQVPHRLLTGLAAKVTGDNVYMSEAVPLFLGVEGSRKRAAGLASELVRKGYLDKENSKNPIVAGLADKFSIELGTSATTAFEKNEKIPKWLSTSITLPSRMLRAADLYFKSVAFDSQLTANLIRYSKDKGKGWTKEQIHERFINILVSKSDVSSKVLGINKRDINKMIDDSITYANYTTFMDTPGKMTKRLSDWRNAIPMGRVFVPFINTLVNITKRGLEMTPGLGMLAYKPLNRPLRIKGKDVPRSGVNTADMLAKQIEGTIMTAIIMSLFDWDKLTADAPRNPAQRERFYAQGKLPWSFKAGDKWIEYRDIEPFSTVFGMLGSAYQAISQAKDDATATAIFADAAYTFRGFIADSTWLGGVQNIMRDKGIANQVQRIPASLVPYSAAFGAIKRGLEGALEGKRVLAEKPEGFYDGILSNIQQKDITGTMEKPPARLDVWGEEVSIPGGFLRQWLPWKFSSETADKTELELARIAIYPAPPGSKVTIQHQVVDLPPEVYRDYQLYFGQKAKSHLDRLIGNPGYQNLNLDQRYKRIDRTLRRVRLRAVRKVRSEVLRHHRDLLVQKRP